MDRTNICFYHNGSWGRGFGYRKASLSPQVIHYWTFQGGSFIVLLFLHYENMPIQIYWKFYHQKWKFSEKKKSWYLLYFCSKHRLRVLVRTASPCLLVGFFLSTNVIYSAKKHNYWQYNPFIFVTIIHQHADSHIIIIIIALFPWFVLTALL